MKVYIRNITNGDSEEISFKDLRYTSKIVGIISKILTFEPKHEYSDDESQLCIELTAKQLNNLFEHMKETKEDLAKIVYIEQFDRLRGVKYADY
jgi:transcriptional antiterminator